ncbi:hypothetical protein BFL40_19805 [Pseudomonas costantinii]|uniref:Uncharacterized protein n=2 Tax=Pseudomonas costantinii TaxID=168469 RepID=A0A1S2UVN1_9PSED|nr:hypothetical protein BFL40_19805 [Pseudomonas costantinii]
MSISSIELDADRDRRLEQEYWVQADAARSCNCMSMAQALASEFGISVEDGELLAGSEITAHESDDGFVYSYWINFEPEAQGELRADLLARFGSLEYDLHANFFDDVEPA